MLKHNERIAAVEGFYRFSPQGHIAFSNSLPQHVQLKAFPLKQVVETERKPWERMPQYIAVVIIDNTIAIAVFIFNISRFGRYANGKRGVFNIAFVLEQAICFIAVVAVQRQAYPNDAFNFIGLAYLFISFEFGYLIPRVGYIKSGTYD